MQRDNDKRKASEGKSNLDVLAQERATKSNAIEVPQISLPKGGGAIKGIDEKFQVNPANGTASFSIPLPLSPNRNGFTPALSISYNSGAGNSLLGIGWGIDLPSIQRRTDKKLPRYLDQHKTDDTSQELSIKAAQEDTFLFSGAEELVPFLALNDKNQWQVRQFEDSTKQCSIRQYRPRIEGGFSRIERIDHKEKGYYWRVTSKENITTFFGYTESCRIYDPTDPSKIFEWLPEFSFDDKGSWVWYAYKEENLDAVKNEVHEKNRFNQLAPFTNKHLKRLKYGNQDAYYRDEAMPYEVAFPEKTAHFFELVFDYGEHGTKNNPTYAETATWKSRADAFSSFRSCFEMRTYRLCQRVLMFHIFPNDENGKSRLNNGEPTLVRSLNFDYQFSNLYEKDADLSQYSAEVTYLAAIEQTGYTKTGTGYQHKSLPKMAFEYQKLSWNKAIQTVSSENLVHAPVGLAGNYQWVDLYNEGINGILTEQANAWLYKSNLGTVENGELQFSQAQPVIPKPSFTGLSNGTLQLQDLEANGEKQLVVTTKGTQGYFELTDEGEWQPFKAFLQTLNLDLRDPNVRMLDVNGDGKPEVVLSDLGAFWFWENAGKIGYDAPELAVKPYDEEQGVSIVFSDQEQCVFLADMSGDGLTDIVRIRNGEVCYWANMGYGRFSAKVTMSNAPVFDYPDMFNPGYLQLADISGTGATDILYLGNCPAGNIKAYLNLSGNAWSNAIEIESFFPTEQPNRITVTDLLGNGTACIVWSSEMPAYSAAPMRYMDLMGGKKPHIMCSHENGLGKKTALEYKSSTWYYLKDKLAGTPWITKLAFPVQCVSKTIITEGVTNVRFTAEYTYHHGYYDHVEREFRGFGRVDQTDTEDYEKWSESKPSNGQSGKEHHEPPVLTRTWFHTGAFTAQDRILKQYEQEYWYNAVNSELNDDVLDDAFIDFPQSMEHLSAEEWREAARACKGMALRQEVFALDESDKALVPYSVATHTCFIRLLQPRTLNQYAVFIALESEALQFSYERVPKDARVAHTMNLEIDQNANVTKAVSIVYGRQTGQQSPLPAYNFQNEHQVILNREQHKTHVILTETDFTTSDLTQNAAFYRLPLPYQVKTYECQGDDFNKQSGFFTKEEINKALNGLAELPYEATNTTKGKRLIEHIQTLYRSNDLTKALPLSELESLALPWEAYQLAFTPEMLTSLYGDKRPADSFDNFLVHKARFEKTDGTNYWISSGKPIFFNEGRNEKDVINEFYLPAGYEDPFEINTWVEFDPLLLYIKSATDALGNQTSVEEFNFRTLSPVKMKDINGNFAEVVIDALGMVVATAIYGKDGQGDTLENGDWYFTQDRINKFFDDPYNEAAKVIGNATACLVYDLDRNDQQPTRVATITRETHYKTLEKDVLIENTDSKYQISIEYSDGLGNIALKKIQAEPEATGAALRWIGNGRTVLNNKGKPVKQYEPYFSATPDYESETDFSRNQGVTPILYYDAIGRNTKTELPDQTFTKVEFNAWEQRSFDQNDTIGKRKADGSLENTCDWYNARINGDCGIKEQQAAQKAAVHADTPSIIYLDSLGRPFFSIDHNRWNQADSNSFIITEVYQPTYVDLDIEGNVHNVVDARNNTVMSYQYDMLGHRLCQSGMDNGRRWMLNDCMGKPAFVWDENGLINAAGTVEQYELRTLCTEYDDLHRPVQTFLDINGQICLVEDTVYDTAENGKGQIHIHRDGAGQTTNSRYDFKGNLLETQKQIPLDFKASIVDWKNPQFEPEVYTLITEYDALNRMRLLYNWHYQNKQGETRVSIYLPHYSPRGVLESENLIVNALKTKEGYSIDSKTAPQTTIVKDITYDAKGQRTRMRQNDGKTTTCYHYDPQTFRLIQLRTTRHSQDPCERLAKSNLNDPNVLQNLFYTYDPVGNITEIYDDAYEPVFFNNQKIEPKCTYEYDALYQLILATGKENASFNQAPQNKEPEPVNLGDGALRNFTQFYQYDVVGNILQMRHSAGVGKATAQWTRHYTYENTSNRLVHTKPNDVNPAVDYRYDIHGNMLNLVMTSKNHITWDYRDMIQQYDLGGGGYAYYQYGNDKQRSRKVITNGHIIEERLYLGGMERYRRWENGNTDPVEEIETHHVFEGEQRILMVENVICTDNQQLNTGLLFRYQYSNHLGSSSVELNGNGDIITYEEYHPYGTTAYQARNAAIKAAAKRYRYTGMERDEETGLSYHSARYYLLSLSRWLTCDSKMLVGGINLYQFASDNPVLFVDKKGYQDTLFQREFDWKSKINITLESEGVGIVAKEKFEETTGLYLPLLDRPNLQPKWFDSKLDSSGYEIWMTNEETNSANTFKVTLSLSLDPSLKLLFNTQEFALKYSLSDNELMLSYHSNKSNFGLEAKVIPSGQKSFSIAFGSGMDKSFDYFKLKEDVTTKGQKIFTEQKFEKESNDELNNMDTIDKIKYYKNDIIYNGFSPLGGGAVATKDFVDSLTSINSSGAFFIVKFSIKENDIKIPIYGAEGDLSVDQLLWKVTIDLGVHF